jgi:hypothetical protein
VLTAPVEGVSPIPVGQLPLFAIVELPDVPSVASTPLIVSFVATLEIGLDAVPASAVPDSAVAITVWACAGSTNKTVTAKNALFIMDSFFLVNLRRSTRAQALSCDATLLAV